MELEKTGEKGGEGVHDEHHLLLGKALAQQEPSKQLCISKALRKQGLCCCVYHCVLQLKFYESCKGLPVLPQDPQKAHNLLYSMQHLECYVFDSSSFSCKISRLQHGSSNAHPHLARMAQHGLTIGMCRSSDSLRCVQVCAGFWPCARIGTQGS